MARIEVCTFFCGKVMINESSTPPGLGRGISRLHPYERNEQPQWQGLKYVDLFFLQNDG